MCVRQETFCREHWFSVVWERRPLNEAVPSCGHQSSRAAVVCQVVEHQEKKHFFEKMQKQQEDVNAKVHRVQRAHDISSRVISGLVRSKPRHAVVDGCSSLPVSSN